MIAYESVKEKNRQVRADFLLAHAALALTFISVAETTTHEESRRRNVLHARRALERIGSKRPFYELNSDQRRSLGDQLSLLRGRIEYVERGKAAEASCQLAREA